MLVSDQVTNSVIAYHPNTFQFDRVFIPSGSGGLDGAGSLVVHGGFLFIASYGNRKVMRFDAVTGSPAPAPGQSGAIFATVCDGGPSYDGPIDIKIGSDGNLYLACNGNGFVERYDGVSGAQLPAAGNEGTATFAVTLQNTGLDFDPDGNLDVANFSPASVWRMNGVTGAYVDTFIPESLTE